MKIYNSLTRRKEEFVPIEEGKVKMYACGITVSGEAHIGHAFQAMLYDIFRKFLEKQGYQVTYARNYTDVDDKIIARSKETGIPADKYAEMMIKKIDHVMREFDVDDPTLWLKATENIGNIISFVEALISSGHAYAADNGDVYFDVDTFPAYGQLSGRDKEDALDGVRVENDDSKRHPYDFALWKAAKPGEICWDSPWGKGRRDLLGFAVGKGAPRLAHRVLGDEPRRLRRSDRHPRRRERPHLPPSRERDRPERGAHGQEVRKVLDAQRAHQGQRAEDEQVARQQPAP